MTPKIERNEVLATAAEPTVDYLAPGTIDHVPTPGQSIQEAASPAQAPGAAVQLGHRLGRYCVELILGQGGFGQVFLARDEELQRRVAIKVATRITSGVSAEAYLDEARTVARLDHPHIVPVYDLGRTEQGQLFIVSKLIEGRDPEILARLRIQVGAGRRG